MPVVGVTVAIVATELDQVPPNVPSLSAIVWPTQTTESPNTGVIGFTTTGFGVKQVAVP